jgi:two-component system phosphate regulon sensor histidine kinase PhoR
MPSSSLFLKFFAFLITIFLFSFFLIFIFPIGKIRDYAISIEEEKIKLYYDPLTGPIGELLLNNKTNEIENIIGIYYDKTGDGISVNNINGLSIHSDRRPAFPNVSLNIPLLKDKKVFGNILIDRFSKPVESFYKGIITETIIILMTMLSLISAVMLRLSGSIIFFKNEITGAMKAFGEGALTRRIFPSFKGEFKGFTDAFNNMADNLFSRITELNQEKEEMLAIVSSISSGIAVLDKTGKIILANNVFMDIFGCRIAKGRYYWEIIINARLGDLVNQVQEDMKSLSCEIGHAGRTYRVDLSYVMKTSETVMIFYDLTDIKNLEKIKKDFVGNVSHELKTPLTSIKGFTESLLEEEKDSEKKHKLDIILRNVVRLGNIIQDLLTLSELEEPPKFIEKEKVSLKEVFHNIKDIFSTALKIKKIYLDIKISDIIPEIEGDPFQIEQLFVNLIDNAIKYTDKGGVSVNAYLYEESVRVDIEDTGIGISEEHIPRLFERFYVVNKARSKSLGGTGLGLSIVKHILMLHGGKIEVGSRLGRGTKFVITLPLKTP